mmetsp:Transcript_62936/g.87025  ORF Transcript_62936/g.87025 Transcript_62936/m.87025 type:complete len:89 (+) Transcript_62936:221-487(+)
MGGRHDDETTSPTKQCLSLADCAEFAKLGEPAAVSLFSCSGLQGCLRQLKTELHATRLAAAGLIKPCHVPGAGQRPPSSASAPSCCGL